MTKLPILLFLGSVPLMAQIQAPAGDVSCANANACWDILEQGNLHWADEPIRLTHPNQTAARRSEVANPQKQQKPFAVILTCSDSRVPPELIFDRGLGDLFVIRLAGNLIGKDADQDFALASIQYAIGTLKTKLVVVLGHQQCGAAKAALTHDPHNPGPRPLRSLVEALLPAVTWARHTWGSSITMDDVSDANVYQIIPRVEAIAGSGSVKGKRYNLNGKVVDLRPKS